MVDWIVLLTPLAILPVILLFAFVGCTNDYGALTVANDLTLTLHYDGNFNSDIHTIKVIYTIHQDGREDHSETDTLLYKPTGGFWAVAGWDEPGIETSVTCNCALLKKPVLTDETPPPPIVPSGSPLTKTKESESAVDFFLSQQGDGYLLA
ncbi:MAG TPA: hypothetical protein VHX16_18165 [Chloroflexota bacterium]|nr:hypothetical protein [Chloroflexota bacterium]